MEQSDDQRDDAGPALKDHVEELQGQFPSDATMQDALSRLTLLGFDRADFSVPDPDPAVATPEQGADAAPTHVDNTQLRTMASGMTGTVAGMAIGALAATGGIAAPVIAAAAGASALGAAAATSGLGVGAEQAAVAGRDRLGAEGKLVLAVRIRNAAHLESAESAMRDAGATAVSRVQRVQEALTRGVSATSWTGN